MKVLQNPPTRQSCPYKQASIHYGNPFERDFICNDIVSSLNFINVFLGVTLWKE